MDARPTPLTDSAIKTIRVQEGVLPEWDQLIEHARQLERSNAELGEALQALIVAWESISEETQVPDEINVDEHWEAARTALRNAGIET